MAVLASHWQFHTGPKNCEMTAGKDRRRNLKKDARTVSDHQKLIHSFCYALTELEDRFFEQGLDPDQVRDIYRGSAADVSKMWSRFVGFEKESI